MAHQQVDLATTPVDIAPSDAEPPSGEEVGGQVFADAAQRSAMTG